MSKEMLSAYNRQWTIRKKENHEKNLSQLKGWYKGKAHGFGMSRQVVLKEAKRYKPNTTKYV